MRSKEFGDVQELQNLDELKFPRVKCIYECERERLGQWVWSAFGVNAGLPTSSVQKS